MQFNRAILGLCAAALAFAPAAHAASPAFGFPEHDGHDGPIAKMSCTGSSQTTKFDLSYFSLGTSDANQPVTGTGPTAGRADALLPLTIHTGFAHVDVLGETYGNGNSFATCMLTFADGSGNVSVTLDNVMVQTLEAVGKKATQTEPAETYLEVQFTYKGASVTINGTTVGSSVTTAWK